MAQPNATVNKVSNAAIAQLSITTNSFNELVITGQYQGTPLAQTIPVQPGSVLTFDTENNNFQVHQLNENVAATEQFVAFIRDVT